MVVSSLFGSWLRGGRPNEPTAPTENKKEDSKSLATKKKKNAKPAKSQIAPEPAPTTAMKEIVCIDDSDEEEAPNTKPASKTTETAKPAAESKVATTKTSAGVAAPKMEQSPSPPRCGNFASLPKESNRNNKTIRKRRCIQESKLSEPSSPRRRRRHCSIQECKQQSGSHTDVNRKRKAAPSASTPGQILPSVPVGGIQKQCCFRCHVDLHPATSLYVPHAHPVLPRTVLCAVCADDTANDDVCPGCHGTDHVQVLCDSCDGALCTDCIQRCGTKPIDLERIVNDESTAWDCPACASDDDAPVLPSLPSSFEDLVDRLYRTEVEKKLCEEQLETELSERQIEIQAEIGACNTAAVDQELQVLRGEWEAHHVRLADAVARIQDELQTQYNIDLAILYNKIFLDSPDLQQRPQPDDTHAINALLDQRQPSTYTHHDPSIYDMDVDDIQHNSIEDLGTETVTAIPGHDTLCTRGWRQVKSNVVSAEQLQATLRVENARLHNVPVTVRNETQDAQLQGQEELKVVRRRRKRRRRESPVAATGDSAATDDDTAATATVMDMAPIAESTVTSTEDNEPEATATPKAAEVPLIMADSTPAPADGDDPEADASTPLPRTTAAAAAAEITPIADSTTAPSAVNDPPDPAPFTPKVENEDERKLPAIGSAQRKEKQKEASQQQQQLGSTELPSTASIRPVPVHPALAKHLKPHQVSGIQVMWNNCFHDFDNNGEKSKMGGCILAHAMGLGKSLSTICLIHTVMSNAPTKDTMRKILLVVPVNTLQNWLNEFGMWLRGVEPNNISIRNLSDSIKEARYSQICEWDRLGGVLLMSEGIFRSEAKHNLNPDLLVVDEAHTMLKNSDNATFKALMKIPTQRKLALTGSPFQNNLVEYYHLLNFVRPGSLGMANVAQYQSMFVDPISKGMLKTATANEVHRCLLQARRLNSIVRPYMDRVGANTLCEDLEPMHQIVLHVRQTKLQTRLYGLYSKKKKKHPELDKFLAMYSNLRPVHCHPGSLTFAKAKAKDEVEWWHGIKDATDMRRVTHGNKIVILLHIITYALEVGDKVLVYANSIPTLDYIEYVLNLEDWGAHVPSLKQAFPNSRLGSWKSSKDYFRIDGGTGSQLRGFNIDKFNNDVRAKVFLLSKAGGIGINLTSANRVVLLDNHFNPTVASQAVSRSYRFGQTKPVLCYHLLTQGSMEESVYSRSVTKTGVSFLVVDEKAIERNFSSQELEFTTLGWAQCDKCEKWRCLVPKNGIPQDIENLPDKWYCSMNSDEENNSCDHSEKPQSWYEEKLAAATNNKTSALGEDAEITKVPASERIDDPILKHILGLTAHQKETPLISKNYLHDVLLETKDSLDALEDVVAQVKEHEEATKQEEEKQKTQAASLGAVCQTKQHNASAASAARIKAADLGQIPDSSKPVRPAAARTKAADLGQNPDSSTPVKPAAARMKAAVLSQNPDSSKPAKPAAARMKAGQKPDSSKPVKPAAARMKAAVLGQNPDSSKPVKPAAAKMTAAVLGQNPDSSKPIRPAAATVNQSISLNPLTRGVSPDGQDVIERARALVMNGSQRPAPSATLSSSTEPKNTGRSEGASKDIAIDLCSSDEE